jgi:hypothetical protein
MSCPEILYHGSIKKVDELELRKSLDLVKKEGNVNAVYATRVKDFAIAMALRSLFGGNSSVSVNGRKVECVLYDNQKFPSGNENIYLYTLNIAGFENFPVGSHQYISLESVKPIEVQNINVGNYLYLVRRATKIEKEEWLSRHGGNQI